MKIRSISVIVCEACATAFIEVSGRYRLSELARETDVACRRFEDDGPDEIRNACRFCEASAGGRVTLH